jgi:hypothetical protein
LLVAVGLLSTAVAEAQESGSTFPQPSQSPPLSYRHASTLQEGVLRGRADVIRAAGEFNYNTAAAALIFEEARKANYANELRHAETFWAKRSLYDTQMAARKLKRTHVTKPAVEPVAHHVPQPFIDPSQPGFVWPAAFDHPVFAGSRERLAVLFAQRSPADSGPQSTSYLRIQNTTVEMRSLLRDLIREMPPMVYVEARQFLDRAAYEAGQPVQIKVAALN